MTVYTQYIRNVEFSIKCGPMILAANDFIPVLEQLLIEKAIPLLSHSWQPPFGSYNVEFSL